jgi:hypothetical protein
MAKKSDKKKSTTQKEERTMSFIEQALGTYQEKEVAPEDTYDLTVKDAKLRGNNILVILTIDGEGNYENILHNVSLVTGDDDPEKANFKLGFQRAFLDAFSIPYDDNGFDLSDFPGATGESIPVVQDTYEGRLQNKLQLNP